EQTLSYRKKFGSKHSFGALVGNTLQSDVYTRTAAEGRGFANNAFKLISQAATSTASQSWTKGNLASFFSKIDYNYGGKYLFDFSIRADGASKFGADRKWGYFPAVGFAWKLKQEKFLSDVDAISNF